MTDESGSIVWKADYLPFGKAIVDPASTITNDFRFPGQTFDSETGYHYNWNRYYDPETGRYLTADPIGILMGRNHLYNYTGGNPVNYVDPNGLVPGPQQPSVVSQYEVAMAAGQYEQAAAIAEAMGWGALAAAANSAAMSGSDDWVETTEQQSKPEVPDMTNSPEACRLRYEARVEVCKCKGVNVKSCIAKAWLLYIGCMMDNLGS